MASTLLKDLITIPHRVHHGDFVLRLTEGVLDPQATLGEYVVTEALVGNFDHALDLIRSATERGTSKAAYLHGSFGSGKSHFMAVLYLLLRGEPAARGIPELAPVVDRYADWLAGKKFLMVPYHLIGAHNLESAILGGYAEHVRRLHPEAPSPAVYLSEGLLADAENLRRKMGDADFFANLAGGEAAEGGGGWGALEKGWDAASFAAAAGAPPGDAERQRLLGHLIDAYFPNHPRAAKETGEGFVGLDSGLAVISRHTQALGYDALVLFLDELILWLASHAGDLAFLTREGQKLAKLVESSEAHRPVPVVSFIARQRDLRELVGEHVPGAEKLSFGDILRWWEGRFDTITLENRNLPTIVEKRLLTPRSAEAKSELDRAFAQTIQTRDEILAVLQGNEADRAAFRRVYPFSPALVETLVAVSSVLQRERTALKLLLQLLVDQRETLAVGDLVPVGDLYDVLEAGEEPFTEELRRHFDSARRLYGEKLRPVIEARLGLAPGEQPEPGPRADALRTDERLAKTLLLAALAPEAEALRALTPSRLAALNHGTIRAPLPGREAGTVLQRCREWAQSVGELRVGEGSDPVVTVQLSGVDTQSILDKARTEDNQGNRQRKLRQALFEALGLGGAEELFQEYELLWKGTRRRFEILFGNVRELPDDSLRARGERWRIVLDFPFDPDNRSPRDDLARLEEVAESTRTVCWLPSFFSRDTLEKLGRLVVLDHVLTGERFRDLASHLSAVDQQTARGLLENQRVQLQQGLRQALLVAYGVADQPRGAVDEALGMEEHLHSLCTGFQPRPPAAADLEGALSRLAAQMLEFQYPAHPTILLDREVRPKDLEQILAQVERATEDPDGRVRVEEPKVRDLLRAVAEPLRIGEMHEAHFRLTGDWPQRLRQGLGGEPDEVSVRQVRELLDRPDPMGLPRALQDTLVRAWALQSGRGFFLHGRAVDPAGLADLLDEVMLRREPLPDEEEWRRALERAGRLLGVPPPHSQVRTAGNVSTLAAELRARAAEHEPACRELIGQLERVRRRLGLPAEGERSRLAETALRVLETLVREAKPAATIRTLAALAAGDPDEAVGRSIRSAGTVGRALREADWQVFDACWALADERQGRARENRTAVEAAVDRGELAIALEPELARLRGEALQILVPPPTPPPQPPAGRRTVERGKSGALRPEEARVLLQRLGSLLADGTGRELAVEWTITEPKEDGPS